MERLIDADELLKAMDTWDKFGYSTRYGLEQLDKDDKDFVPYVHYNDMLKAVNGMSTVEAIPKEQYEARLKAHLVAILEDIQLEIEEIVKEERLIDKKWADGLHYSEKIIQQKIDKLKEKEVKK